MKMHFDKPDVIPFFRGYWQDWNGVDWVLVEEWQCRIAMPYKEKPVEFIIIAKPGTRTDFGSIPKFARGWINKMGLGMVGFLPHDMICGCKYFTRHFNDNVMRACHRWAKLSTIKNEAMYHAVRWAGSGYQDHTEKSIRLHREHIDIIPIIGITKKDIIHS